jgi:hypothetical protein
VNELRWYASLRHCVTYNHVQRDVKRSTIARERTNKTKSTTKIVKMVAAEPIVAVIVVTVGSLGSGGKSGLNMRHVPSIGRENRAD